MVEHYLAELPESEASAAVREIYDDIRETLGLPVVNLLYRHLAVEPGRLESTWAELRPVLKDPATHALAAALAARVPAPTLAPVSVAALAVVGIGEAELARVEATLSVYERANARNLVALRVLLGGSDGVRRRMPTGLAPAPLAGEPLPMADLARLPPSVRALLHEVSAAVIGGGEPILVPSLLRHFVHEPGLLALAWTAVRSRLTDDALRRLASPVREHACVLAALFPSPVRPIEDPGAREVLERFAEPIARMLVVGALIGRALGVPRV